MLLTETANHVQKYLLRVCAGICFRDTSLYYIHKCHAELFNIYYSVFFLIIRTFVYLIKI